MLILSLHGQTYSSVDTVGTDSTNMDESIILTVYFS